MPSVLITGSNRGIGLEWARQYAREGWRVFATCRHPAEATTLQRLADSQRELTIHRLDVTSTEDLVSIRHELRHESIDVLLNNAGIYLERQLRLGCLRYGDWLRTLEVNALGAVRVTEALAEKIARSERRLVVATSSHMGSISDIQSPGAYYYRSSKAALNAAMRGLGQELEQRGIGVLILHPGAVDTRMGPGGGATAEQSVRGMRQLVENFQPAWSGRFFRFDGTELPW